MKFLVADDHAIVRKGLVRILLEEFPLAEFTEATNGNEVINLIGKQKWDVILLDISMPKLNGIETLKQIRAMSINTPVLMLSLHPEEQYAIRTLKAGATGYLTKETAIEELAKAIHLLLQGRKYITHTIAEKLSARIDKKVSYELLSDREMQVLQLIAQGKTVSEIATKISLSVNTISTYRARILEKLELRTNAELIHFSIHNNL